MNIILRNMLVEIMYIIAIQIRVWVIQFDIESPIFLIVL